MAAVGRFVTPPSAWTLLLRQKFNESCSTFYSSSQDDQDGVYWFTSNVGGRNYNVARNIGFPLADGPKDKRFKRGQNPPRGPHADFGFGSWHQGVVQFLLADGSVNAMSVSTNVDVLQRYGNAQDGIIGCNDE
jgi:hypothetical protein